VRCIVECRFSETIFNSFFYIASTCSHCVLCSMFLCYKESYKLILNTCQAYCVCILSDVEKLFDRRHFIKKNYGSVTCGGSRAWYRSPSREPLTASLSRAVNNFSTTRRYRASARYRSRTYGCVNALRGLFKRMHPARVPHSCSPGRASFTCRVAAETGCRPSRRFDIPAGVFDRTKVNAA